MNKLDALKHNLKKIREELDKAEALLIDLEGSKKANTAHKKQESKQSAKVNKPTELDLDQNTFQIDLTSNAEDTGNSLSSNQQVSTPTQKEATKQEDKVKEDYREIDGQFGVFDGTYMITDSGEKFEVPANYAAKSKLVYGDKLKRILSNGKELYKHVNKQERKRISGLLTKKGEDWFFVTDASSYKISSNAAKYQNVEEGMEAVALIPASIEDCPFATLDKVTKENTKKPSPVPPVVETPEAVTAKLNDVPQSPPQSIPDLVQPTTPDSYDKEDLPEMNSKSTEDLGEFNPRQLLDEDLR